MSVSVTMQRAAAVQKAPCTMLSFARRDMAICVPVSCLMVRPPRQWRGGQGWAWGRDATWSG
ncbi:hypothetical protein DDE01_23290 [Desulfovibrio desulfuricans]|nr:hypothetical protein DDE01_23290 [Desulfovibrio desulfuricans]